MYPGRVVAFAIDNEELGTQSIAVVAEMSGVSDEATAERIEREIRNLITASLGIAPRYVRVVPQRWIVKSTAGKISRRDTRNRFLKESKILSLWRPQIPLDRENARQAAREAIAEITKRSVQDSQRIISTGMIDSLSVLKLIAVLEEKLQIQIPKEQVQPEDFDSVEIILDTIERTGL